MDFIIKNVVRKSIFVLVGFLSGLGWSHTVVQAGEVEEKGSHSKYYYNGEKLPVAEVLYPLIYDFCYAANPLELMVPEYMGYTFEHSEASNNSVYFVDSHGYFVSSFIGKKSGQFCLCYSQLRKNDNGSLSQRCTMGDKRVVSLPAKFNYGKELFISQNSEHSIVLNDSNNNFYVILPTPEGPKFQYKIKSVPEVLQVITGDAASDKYFMSYPDGVGLVQQDRKTGNVKILWRKSFQRKKGIKYEALPNVNISCNRDMSRLIVKRTLVDTTIPKEDRDDNISSEFSILNGMTGELLVSYDINDDPDEPIDCRLEKECVGYQIVCDNGKVKSYDENHVLQKVITIKFPKDFTVSTAHMGSDCTRILWSGITEDNEVIRPTFLLSHIGAQDILTIKLELSNFEITRGVLNSPHDSRLHNFMLRWPGQSSTSTRHMEDEDEGDEEEVDEKLERGILFAAYHLNPDAGFFKLGYKAKIFLKDFSQALGIVRNQRQHNRKQFEKDREEYYEAAERGEKRHFPRRPYPVRAIIFERSEVYQMFKALPESVQATLCRNFKDLFRIYPRNHPREWCPIRETTDHVSLLSGQTSSVKRKALL